MAREDLNTPLGGRIVCNGVCHKDEGVWLYRYPKELWPEVVERIMADLAEGKIPEEAARILVAAVSER